MYDLQAQITNIYIRKTEYKTKFCQGRDEHVGSMTNILVMLMMLWRLTKAALQDAGVKMHRAQVCVGGVEISPVSEHHSRCSIFTLGGFRKVLFFFSLCFFPLAWKVLQLSTRPSRVSWHTVRVIKKGDLHSLKLIKFASRVEDTNLKIFLPLSVALCFFCCFDFLLSGSFPEMEQKEKKHDNVNGDYSTF